MSSCLTSSASSNSNAGNNADGSAAASKPNERRKRKKSYNFQRGHPNHLPLEEVKELLAGFCGGRGREKDGSAASTETETETETDDADDLLLRSSLTYLSDDRGQPEFLDELAAFLARRCRHDDFGISLPAVGPSTSDSDSQNQNQNQNGLFITNGASHGLDLLCATCTEPNDVVLVERPSYFLAFGIFQSHGLVVRGLPTTPNDHRQIDVDALERTLLRDEADPDRKLPRMIYVIPTNQNPTGGNMDVETKRKLAQLSSRFGLLVVADEVYHPLDWRDDDSNAPGGGSSDHGRRPARMALFNDLHQDTNTNIKSKSDDNKRSECVSVSSFTKIFAPGVRCGWIEGPPWVIDRLCRHGYVESGGACAPFVGALMCAALRRGIVDRVLSRLVESYRSKCRLLCDALRERAAAAEPAVTIRFREPCGGYFVWVELPVDSQAFLEFCSEEDRDVRIQFLPGRRCDCVSASSSSSSSATSTATSAITTSASESAEEESLTAPPLDFSHSARLCFAYLDDDDLVDGAECLIACLREFLAERAGSGSAKYNGTLNLA